MPRLASSFRVLSSVLPVLIIAACTPGATPVSTSGDVSIAQGSQAQILLGRQIVISHACGDCHGGFSNPAAPGWLAGVQSPQQEFKIGPCYVTPGAQPCWTTRPKNLTPDPVTGIGRYSERQIFNSMRYGLRPEETPDVAITSSTPGQGNFPANPHYLAPPMPWPGFRHMSDAELWAVAAYLKRGVKPVSNKVADSERPPDFWATVFTPAAMGAYPAAPHPTANEVAVDQPSQAQVARGRWLVISHDCGGCHGGGSDPTAKGWLAGVMDPQQEFKMGPCYVTPGAQPCWTTRPKNLTPDNTTGMGRFSERQIFNALRYGLRPEETADVEITSSTPGQGNFPANPHYLAPPMPWPSWRNMSDEELWAIAAYLKRGVKPVSNKVADSEGPPDFWASAFTVTAIGPYPAAPYPTSNER
jgi:mono/diheme cytochrome c family protein